ncbi:MAG: HEPN domain-containing protein, partial [Dehalococcoidia bacterium]
DRIATAVTTNTEVLAFLAKAEENLASAASELVNGRYNACANRCYYACFQAAIAALMTEGIRPPRGAQGEWGHAFVQAQFAGELANRRTVYPASLRDVLPRLQATRRRADYEPTPVSQTQASRCLRMTQDLVISVRDRGARTR